MGNLDNKEKEFALALEKLTKVAREGGNVVSEDQIREAFSEFELSDTQFDQIVDYLKKKNVGIGEPVDPDEYLTDEEKDYLNDYIESIQNIGDVTDNEKEGITIAAMSGDINARKQLVEVYLKLVPDIAKMYAEQGVYLEDLIGEGNEALLKAVNMLDIIEEPSEADEFVGKLIMDAMEEAVSDSLDEDAREQKAVKQVQEVADKAKELSESLRRKCTVEELIQETGWEEEKILEAIRMSGNKIEDIEFEG
ncbi:MAG: hypothetical protein K6B41_07030 [Butyrivibrio sp.]|nr:hypothetical protein [Butyrivibrio sp.]